MGRQHAEALRAHGGFERALAFYPSLPERLLELENGRGLAGALRRLGRPVLDWWLRRLDMHRPAAYRARSRAFMTSLGMGRDASRHVAVMDLFQNVVGLAARFGLGPFAQQEARAVVPACTTLCVWDNASEDGALRHARNFDFPGVGIWDQAPAVVFCEPEIGLRYGFVTTRGADVPGVTCFNEAGLSLTMHTRLHREVRFDGACVVDLGHEIIRRAETLADAVAIARERPVASTWGVCVSSARERRAIVIETTGRRAEVVTPPTDSSFLGCTNRYHHPRTRRGEALPCPAFEWSCRARERVVASAAARGPLGAADLASLLGDPRDPFDGDRPRATGGIVMQPISVQSVVFEPEARALRISVGRCPSGLGPYVRVHWNWSGPVGAWRAEDPAGGFDIEPLAVEPARNVSNRFTTGRGARAYKAFLRAVQAYEQRHDRARAVEELERAAELDPEEPSYRFLAGLLALSLERFERASAWIERALERETSPLRRAQALLWAARAHNARGATERAREHLKALLATTHPLLERHRLAARLELTRPFPHAACRRMCVSLVLADAW